MSLCSSWRLKAMRPFGVDLSLLRLVEEQRHDLVRQNAANLNSFQAAALTGEDSNSGFRRFQKSGEIFANSFVGAVIDGGSLDSDFERAFYDAGDFIAAGAGLYANRKNHRTIAGSDVELLS